jgi:hypothetical protein
MVYSFRLSEFSGLVGSGFRIHGLGFTSKDLEVSVSA